MLPLLQEHEQPICFFTNKLITKDKKRVKKN
jgi:hypothetical protein